MHPQDLHPTTVPPHLLLRGADAEVDARRAGVRGVLGHYGDVPARADLRPSRLVLGNRIEGRCLNQLVVWYLNASVNLATDLIVFSMPLPVINRLQLRRYQKFMLWGIFCLGFL